EGYDLTVRGSMVYLKTLNGLKRVHAILRRLDDDYCDPLELRSDSALGVAGLLDAVRSGNVLVANALGSGVVESAGLLGFLPKICQYLFDEPLKLPSVPTWWCGEQPVLEDALDKLPQLVVKPTFPSQRFEPVFAQDLDDEQLQTLKQRIARRSYTYVAQQQVPLAQSPVWQPKTKQFLAQASGMRVYAVASDEGYRVMTGGLARVSADSQASVVSMQRGGLSKDVWVCFGQSARSERPKARTIGVRDLLRQDPYLPSRVAENMFWLGRYSERCDNNARLLRSALSRHIELGGESDLALTIALDSCQFLALLPAKEDIGQNRKPYDYTYIYPLGISVNNIKVPDDIDRNFVRGFRIVYVQRTENNKTVVAKGLLHGCFRDEDENNAPYLIPKHGINSYEYYAFPGGGGTHAETANPTGLIGAYTFHSPNTSFLKPNLTSDYLKVEWEFYGRGDVYGDTDEWDNDDFCDGYNFGRRQNYNLNQYTYSRHYFTNELQVNRMLQGLMYAPADTFVNNAS
ncbi:MAG TPA: circularly permuted type 2 ATP-grasp protein, partial [Agitococcus sp.]|nr:circularly permuted type 2 ATP-grasp protein [Agitococcus sp.]